MSRNVGREKQSGDHTSAVARTKETPHDRMILEIVARREHLGEVAFQTAIDYLCSG